MYIMNLVIFWHIFKICIECILWAKFCVNIVFTSVIVVEILFKWF